MIREYLKDALALVCALGCVAVFTLILVALGVK